MLKSIKAISVTVLLVLFVALISLFAGCKFNSCDNCKEIECCYCKYGLECENLSSEWHKKYFESLNYEEINRAKNMAQKIRESYIDEVLIEDKVIEKHIMIDDNIIGANIILVMEYNNKDYKKYCESIVDKYNKSSNMEILLINSKNKCVYQFKNN